MIGLPYLAVYNSFFTITEENVKFELHSDTCDKVSFEELKYELEEMLSISDITPSHLQHEIVGPRITQAYRRIEDQKNPAPMVIKKY